MSARENNLESSDSEYPISDDAQSFEFSDEEVPPPKKMRRSRKLSESSEERDDNEEEIFERYPADSIDDRDFSTSAPLLKLESEFDRIIECHKENLKNSRRQEKASNAEFLNSVILMTRREEVLVDNREDLAVMIKGENLLELQAGHEPSKFGRELARKIFGKKNNCKLQEKMLGPGRRMSDQRGRVDEHVEKIFNGICFFLIWKKSSENSQESQLKN